MNDPVKHFQESVLPLKPGESFLYHTGHLARDRENSTSTNVIGMLSFGLQLIGAVQLWTRRVNARVTEYHLRVKRPIRKVDFDYGRKTYLEHSRKED